jgi:hypothetical protein
MVLATGTFAIGTDAFVIGGVLPAAAPAASVSQQARPVCLSQPSPLPTHSAHRSLLSPARGWPGGHSWCRPGRPVPRRHDQHGATGIRRCLSGRQHPRRPAHRPLRRVSRGCRRSRGAHPTPGSGAASTQRLKRAEHPFMSTVNDHAVPPRRGAERREYACRLNRGRLRTVRRPCGLSRTRPSGVNQPPRRGRPGQRRRAGGAPRRARRWAGTAGRAVLGSGAAGRRGGRSGRSPGSAASTHGW